MILSSDVAKFHAPQGMDSVGNSQRMVPGDPRSQATFVRYPSEVIWDHEAEFHPTTGQVASGALPESPRGGVVDCQEASLWIWKRRVQLKAKRNDQEFSFSI